MSYYENIADEEAKQETFRCVIWAAIVVFGGFCAMIYGLAYLSSVTVTAEDIYARRRMDSSIKTMQNQIDNLYLWRTAMSVEYGKDTLEYKNHAHRYYDGKIK